MASKDFRIDESIVVIGLGRFGSAVAQSLVRLGHEVLAVDESPKLVTHWSEQLTHVVEADGTDEDALRQLGVAEFNHAVVAIGSDLEASVLSVLALNELRVPQIWAKAISAKHGRILSSVGAHHVVYPESSMGERVAHLITGRMLDYIEFDDGYAIAKVRAPKEVVGRSLAESAVRTHHHLTVVGVKVPGSAFTHAAPDTVIPPGAILVVAGRTEQVQRFAANP